jgi:putative flavoprotein involved in K+ transport
MLRCISLQDCGRDVFWWQDRIGLLRVSAESRFGRLMATNDGSVIGSTPDRTPRQAYLDT